MANGLNLRYQPTYGVTGIAQLLAQKPMMEEQIRASQRQGKQQKFNRFLNTISTAAQLGDFARRLNEQRLERERQEQVGELLASAVQAEGITPEQYSQRQAMARGIPGAGGTEAGILSTKAFPGMVEQPKTGSPIGSLTSMLGTLSNQAMMSVPGSPEYNAYIKNMNSVIQRIYALGGVEGDISEIPLPPEVSAEPTAKGPGIIERIGGGIKSLFPGPGEAEAAPPSQKVNQKDVPRNIIWKLKDEPLGTEADVGEKTYRKTVKGVIRVR